MPHDVLSPECFPFEIHRNADVTILRKLLAAVLLPGFAFLCSASAADERVRERTAEAPSCERVTVAGLPNAHQINAKLLFGGQPDARAGWSSLKALGVKTVISVDGVMPDVTSARASGIRYVHLPHGYDGIPENRVVELASAVQRLKGPIYIHCHHGTHRSPAAAAVACVAAGLLSPETGEQILRTAGTSVRYAGLYDVVRTTRPLDSGALNSSAVRFTESVPPPPIVRLMAELERTVDRLDMIAASGWESDPLRPKSGPQHEALMLKEHLTEFHRVIVEENTNVRREQGFSEQSAIARRRASALAALLVKAPKSPQELADADSAFAAVKANCAECHRRYRD